MFNHNKKWCMIFFISICVSPMVFADTEIPIDNNQLAEIQPLTKAEIQQLLSEMQQRQNQRIEEWGKTLKAEDFERTWLGRQLKKPKRQEVCGIYQGLVNETYALAQKNKLRLPKSDQQFLEDRDLFIQSLGYKDNIVDTKMGFNCRLR